MKNKFIIITIIGFLLMTQNTYAKELYYQNINGVAFTQEEYEFLSDFYFEGYQDYMTQEDYNEFVESDIINGEIKIKESSKIKDYYIMPLLDVSHSDNKKTIKLSSSCIGTNCDIGITLSWNQDPTIRSYDLIGSYVENTQITRRNRSYLLYNGITNDPIEQRMQSNAFSSTYKLPSSGSVIRIVEKFNVNNSGKVIASYQHATQNISLTTSRNYNFSTNGYGAVFAFHSGAGSYYDGMLGVYLMLG